MKVIPELDEINMGEWDGLLFDDIRRRFPEAYAERGRRFGDFRPPGGESFNDVGDRVLKVLAELGAGPKPIFAVTHAGVIRATLCRATGRPMDALFHFSPGHAECTVFAPSTRGLELVVTGIAPEDLGSFL